jgi:hypothetical protein
VVGRSTPFTRRRDAGDNHPGIEVVKVPEEKPLSIRLLEPPEMSFEGRSLRFGRRKVLGPLLQRPPSRL